MSPARDSTPEQSGVSRRTVLQLLGAAGAAGVAASASANEQEDGAPYAVVQGDECVPLEPLSGTEPVEELYDYRVPEGFQGDNGATDTNTSPYYQSNGTTDLQQADVSIAFLYDGPNGLSLVVVHDSPGSNAGGSVSFTFSGVPDGADWAVKDDLYFDPDNPDSHNFDNWNTDGTSHSIDWTWGSAGTDGGALRTSGELGITIEPAFNDAATLWGEHYAEDPIEDWQFLSFPDGRSNPERTSLAMDQSVTINAEPCEAKVEAGPLTADIDVKPGSDRNPVNPVSQGNLPVKLHSTDELDYGDVDVATLRFGPPRVVDEGDGAGAAHGGHDEDDALVLHFSTPVAGFESGDAEAKLVGKTTEGQELVGTDEITIVGGGNGRNDDAEEDDDDDEDEETREEKEERKEEKREEKEERKEEKREEKEEKREEKEERKEEKREEKEERKEEKRERKEEKREEKRERKEEKQEEKRERKEEKREEREEREEEDEDEDEDEDDDD